MYYKTMKVFALLLLVAACSLGDQSPPGTSTRPLLSENEAALYTKEDYLQEWTPAAIAPNDEDFLVCSTCFFTSIQTAVNVAILSGSTVRRYIKIDTGTYNEVVYIPSTKVALTIFGLGSSASETVITLSLSASITPYEYRSIVNPNGKKFKTGDPAYSMYNDCASKNGTIGTSCSAVFRIKAAKVQIVNLTIQNSSKEGDAVALKTNGDRIQVDNARILGHQHTLWSGTGGNNTQRTHYTNTYIEGDTDFVFGSGSSVFENTVFYVKSDRIPSGVVFAPDTNPNKNYGYLVINSTIAGDYSFLTSKSVYLARSWDSGVLSASAYVPGISPNGQLVIRETIIDFIIPTSAPYTKAATSGREYSGNASPNRSLDDNTFNRFWEYSNTGDILSDN